MNFELELVPCMSIASLGSFLYDECFNIDAYIRAALTIANKHNAPIDVRIPNRGIDDTNKKQLLLNDLRALYHGCMVVSVDHPSVASINPYRFAV